MSIIDDIKTGFSFQYHIDKDFSGIPDKEFAEILALVNKWYPSYLHDWRIKPDSLRHPNLPSGESFTRNIKKYHDYYYGKDTEICDQVKDMFCHMGQIWQKAEVKDMDITGILLSNHEAFANLGHYGCDKDSCFKDGTGNSYMKVNLSRCTNAFVFLAKIGKEPLEVKATRGTYNARMFGFYNEKDNVLNFCNLYTSKINANTLIPAIKRLVAALYGVELDEVGMVTNKVRAYASVYLNLKPSQVDETLSFFLKNEHKDIEEQCLTDPSLSKQVQNQCYKAYGPQRIEL